MNLYERKDSPTPEPESPNTPELDNLDLENLSISYNDDGEVILVRSTPLGEEPVDLKKSLQEPAAEETEVEDTNNTIREQAEAVVSQSEYTRKSQEVSELKKEIEDLKYLMLLQHANTRGQQTPSPEEEEDLMSILGDRQRGDQYLNSKIDNKLNPVLKNVGDVLENLQIKSEFETAKSTYPDFMDKLPKITAVFDESPHLHATFDDAYWIVKAKELKAGGVPQPKKTLQSNPEAIRQLKEKEAKFAPAVTGEAQMGKGLDEEITSPRQAYMKAIRDFASGKY